MPRHHWRIIYFILQFTSCNQLLYGTVCFLFFHQCTPLPLTRFRAALRNPGDRHGLFRFAVPSLFLGRVLGPETYGWLVERYGQASVDRGDIRRARIFFKLFAFILNYFTSVPFVRPLMIKQPSGQVDILCRSHGECLLKLVRR